MHLRCGDRVPSAPAAVHRWSGRSNAFTASRLTGESMDGMTETNLDHFDSEKNPAYGMMLLGASPKVIAEVASRALQFWEQQARLAP